MMWAEIMTRVVTLIENHSVLGQTYSGRVRKASSGGEQQVPGIEWSLIGDTEGELWEPMIVQIDVWYTEFATMLETERIIRSLLPRDLPFKLGGDLMVIASFEGGVDLAMPDRANFYGRGLRFRIAALRNQYAFS